MFCDQGAKIDTKSKSGHPPLMYAAMNNCDDICMYLSLRTTDINFEDELGRTVFTIYLLRKDTERMK